MATTCHESITGPAQRLLESFHALLDESLIVAIANDFNLDNMAEYDAAYDILNNLAQNVSSEEATGFNASGFYGLSNEDQQANYDIMPAMPPLSQDGTDGQMNDTLITQPPYYNSQITSFDDESEEGQLHILQELFPELKSYDVEYSHKKANGVFQVALDDLLNVQYLQATGQQAKGIEGFFDAGAANASNIKYGKRAKKSVYAGLDGVRSLGRLQDITDEVEIAHIAEGCNMSLEEVSKLYHEKHQSSGATIVEILDRHISQRDAQPLNEACQIDIQNLRRKYRHVPHAYLYSAIEVSRSISHFSEGLAAIMDKHFAKKPKAQKLELDHRLTPLPQNEIEVPTAKVGEATFRQGTHAKSLWSSRSTITEGSMDLSQALQRSNAFNRARNDAATSAACLHRRGASNSLYRQAAAYYGERAREQARHARHASSIAADILVNQQSTSQAIDLHGVSVYDGVRIAREKVEDWWQRRGENSRHSAMNTLTVITGVGRHSAGGVSQLRRAVATSLLQDGWRLRVETGKFVISGRR